MTTEMLTTEELLEQHPGVIATIRALQQFVKAGIEAGVSHDDMIAGILHGVVIMATLAQDQDVRDAHAVLFEEWAEFLRSDREAVFTVEGRA